MNDYRNVRLKAIRVGGRSVAALVAMTILSILSVPGLDARTAGAPEMTYENYADVLEKYVDDKGLVDYASLKEHRRKLDAFVEAVGNLDPKTYQGWTKDQKIAFWINVYNGLTLKAIIDNYPIQPSFFRSLRYPENSIRQIPGVWDELKFTVMGRNMTLDEIEHKVLRKEFNEPRIHMALVCAAMGCPELRTEPFTGERLDEQLNDQSAKFMNNPEKFRIDRKEGRVYLSSIFKWFGEDFVKTYGTDKKFKDFGQVERAVLNFASRHVPPKDREYLEKGGYYLDYLSYDWTLNERKK